LYDTTEEFNEKKSRHVSNMADTGVDEVTNRFNRACTIEPTAAAVKQGTGT